MIVYGSSLSFFVRKLLVYADERGIDVELQPTGHPDPSPEFIAASPFQKMPAFRDGDFVLADSSAIIHYLEAKYPNGALIPAEPKARGKVIWFEEFADTMVCACAAKIFFNRIVAPRFLGRDGDLEAAAAAARDELPPILDYLEKVVPEEGRYLVGASLTLADIAIAGPFANFRHTGTEIDAGRWPRTVAYVERILSRPSFALWIERETALLAKFTA